MVCRPQIVGLGILSHDRRHFVTGGVALVPIAGRCLQLEPVLLHLLRNAYDHGLESPAQRFAAGKPVSGTISISLQRRGNLYQLEVADDGSGIDAQAIAQIAQAKGFGFTNIDTDSDLLAILCQPGFSSSSSISEVSGREIGRASCRERV